MQKVKITDSRKGKENVRYVSVKPGQLIPLSKWETLEHCEPEIEPQTAKLLKACGMHPATPADEALQTLIATATNMAQELQDIIADAEQAGSELPGTQTVLNEWEAAFKRYNQLQPQ